MKTEYTEVLGRQSQIKQDQTPTDRTIVHHYNGT